MNTTKRSLRDLCRLAEFVEPEYPSMGYPSENGYARFKCRDIADDLIEALIKNSSYFYAHVLEWEGRGYYDVVPTWKDDHDGQVIYTATFKKRSDSMGSQEELVLKKDYNFEATSDVAKDIEGVLSDIPPDFRGTLKIEVVLETPIRCGAV